MELNPSCWKQSAAFLAAVLVTLFDPGASLAATNVFFNSSQTTNLVTAGTTSDTISSEGYLFTLTRDKLFTGGYGLTNPIGRSIRIPWPDGLEAQAVTTGPAVGGAQIVIKRQDGLPFAITSFTAKILANTAGAGGTFEIMPLLNGQDGVPNPFTYDATGYYGNSFTYNTPELRGFDTYNMSLYVDFAVMSLTVVDASLPPPRLDVLRMGGAAVQLSWPTNASGYALESATNMPSAVWIPVTNGAAINGDLFSVQLDVAGSQQYFRLRK